MSATGVAGNDSTDAPKPSSLADLYLTFTKLALHGFGGVLPWAQRTLVEQRRWLSREEFVELLAFSQLLPGPNVVNLAIIVGDRYFGWRGAVIGLLGMLSVPACVVMAMFLLYAQWSSHPVVQQSMTGMAAVAAGLIMATAIKLGLALRKRWHWLAFGVVSFLMIAIFRVPLLPTLAILLPLAVAAAWWAER